MPLVHHELCFGCGRVNLFGLLLEVEPSGAGAVSGRCFLKQDHQGSDRGRAHDGILAAALTEAMALACGPSATAIALAVELAEAPPVGTFLTVEARVEGRDGATARATATAASDDRRIVARGRGRFQR
jgi:acyl-coenzyme A thioesterase PaaI-like protein